MSYPKESVEAAKGLLAVAAVFAELAKDGVDFKDAVALVAAVQAEPLKSKLAAAIDGISKVPQELKDAEVLDLIQIIPELAPDVLALVNQIAKK